jgi:hypothetical protein
LNQGFAAYRLRQARTWLWHVPLSTTWSVVKWGARDAAMAFLLHKWASGWGLPSISPACTCVEVSVA